MRCLHEEINDKTSCLLKEYVSSGFGALKGPSESLKPLLSTLSVKRRANTTLSISIKLSTSALLVDACCETSLLSPASGRTDCVCCLYPRLSLSLSLSLSTPPGTQRTSASMTLHVHRTASKGRGGHRCLAHIMTACSYLISHVTSVLSAATQDSRLPHTTP